MARFSRVEVIQTVLDAGLVPIFYNENTETAIGLAAACVRGGSRVVEFTNRGEQAYPVFVELARHFSKADPSIILGIGSIQDAPTAALYLAAGANFIVGPNLNPDISRLCNRRKILYIPGCGTETEIANAEELGAEICKVFPAEAVGGPGFIKAVMAPCPWHRLLITGGVDATEESITEWIRSGAAALGMGSKLVTSAIVKKRDEDALTQLTADCLAWIQKARGAPLFLGLEHIGLYPQKAEAGPLQEWYVKTFAWESKEGGSSFFISGGGQGRIEVMKKKAETPVHLAVRVSNFEEAVAALKARGIGVKDPVIKPESKSAYLEMTDPEGNPVHLLWLPKNKERWI